MLRATLVTALVVLALPASAAAAVDLVEGTAGLPQPLVTFSAPAPAQATIDWGDGTAPQTVAVTAAPDGSGTVSGAHAYAKHGSYTVTVTDSADVTVSRTTAATVADAPITAAAVNGPAAAAPGGTTLATIDDANPQGVPESLRASLDWGDGVITDGAVVSAGQPGRYLVRGSHVYPDSGTYVVAVTISSADGGTAQATTEAQLSGTGEPAPAVTQGRTLDLGPSSTGARPSITVDDAGTAFVAWAVRTSAADDSIAFCRVPRGARSCDLRSTLHTKVFASRTTILRGPSGRLYIVAAHILTGRGGTAVLTSPDNGQTWSFRRYDVNVGIFQSAVSSAAVSKDEKAMYITYGPFLNLSGAPLQGVARLDLESSRVAWVGDESFQRRLVVGSAVLPDGRGVAIANRHPDIKEGTLVSMRVVGDATNATTDQPWTPVGGAYAKKIATSANQASILDCSPVAQDPFGTRIGAIELRGLRTDPVRSLGFLRGDNSDCEDADLAYDSAGGRHMTYVADADGCPAGRSSTPGRDGRVCVVYRGARANADFKPKTMLAEIDVRAKVGGEEVGVPQAPRVGAARDGRGWVVWRSFGDGHIRMTPTRDDTEVTAGERHRITVKPLPNGECTNTDTLRLTASVTGPESGRPRITRVTWSAGRGVLPRTQTDEGSPFSFTAKVDDALFRRISSNGVVIVGALARATVRYRTAGGAGRVARLRVPLSYFCSIKWSTAERRYAGARRR